MENFSWKMCCNPFSLPNHKKNVKDLRPVLPWMAQKIPELDVKHKICSGCRRKLNMMPGTSQEFYEEDMPEVGPAVLETADPTLQEAFIDIEKALMCLNECLNHIGEEKISRKRIKDENYIRRILKNAFGKIGEKLFGIKNLDEEKVNSDEYFVRELKDKYRQTNSKEIKYTLLSILPKEWSISKILEEFPGTTTYMARKGKRLQVEEYGTVGHLIQRRSLDPDVMKMVEDFYNNEDVSRLMPGKKDYVSVRVDGMKQHVQKRLILSNLKEVYSYFKGCYPDKLLGFSKFASLRPKNCVLAGSSGTHSICVCTIHQNVKLMLEGSKISKLTINDENRISDYKMCIVLVICNPPNISCYLGNCNNCPRISKLRQSFEEAFENNCVESITYYQWTSTDRANLELRIESSDDFTDSFMRRLLILIPHVFVTEQQNYYLKDLKNSLQSEEFLAIMDFSENYTFIVQDAAQGYHWTNDQATIHPIGIYFRNQAGVVEHTNFVIISDCLKHDTIAVHLFQRHLINYLKSNYGEIKKIYYFSDGSAAQFKNRKFFYNLSMHEEEFKIEAEWNFFATSHGKSICDGLGGTLKRLATKASLQKIQGEAITTPFQLFIWAKEHIRNMNFQYLSLEEYKEEEKILKERYLGLRIVPSTRKLHQICPIRKGHIKVKYFSTSMESYVYSLK